MCLSRSKKVRASTRGIEPVGRSTLFMVRSGRVVKRWRKKSVGAEIGVINGSAGKCKRDGGGIIVTWVTVTAPHVGFTGIWRDAMIPEESRHIGSVLRSENYRSPTSRQVLDTESFKQQESTFVLLNLFVLVVLLLIHALFASHWGDPSRSLIGILAGGILAQGGELLWLQLRVRPLTRRLIAILSWSPIAFNILMALGLATVSNRPDTQYFILLAIPVSVAAFRFALLTSIAVVAVVDFINFLWVWEYARHQPRPPIGEYFEAMTVSLIYAVVGILIWLLVNDLRQKEGKLAQSMIDLEQARERLLREEKLAAVGRLASAIAHEVRNPVGAIVSALSTANQDGLTASDRVEMFQIASKEAGRLERLTSDFLVYARPLGPRRIACSIDDLVGYVAEVCSAKAAESRVALVVEERNGLIAEIDAGQIQRALINLAMNAIEASPHGGRVGLRSTLEPNGMIRIEVSNDGNTILPEIEAIIFEPFFTTKESGTGLGLAIARGIANAHGGDLVLAANDPGRVSFALTFPTSTPPNSNEGGEAIWAEF